MLELVLVVIGVAILTGLVLDRVLPLIGRAQRAAFLEVQRELHSALRFAAAERLARGETAALAELATANPMGLLLEPPANYLGAFPTPSDPEIPRAS